MRSRKSAARSTRMTSDGSALIRYGPCRRRLTNMTKAEERENPNCPECGDQLCASEPEFYPFCVPCGDKLAALVDGATTMKDGDGSNQN
jgi:ribosomal protein L37AE/L43A